MRTRSAVRNTAVAVSTQVIGLIASFIVRIFLVSYCKNYLGINGLFSEIVGVLSIMELGIGSSFSYSLYKPLAQNDTKKLSIIMNLYKKIYVIVGVLILLAGLAITPFVHVFMTDIPLGIGLPELRILFFLYVLNTAVSYFYSYKYNLMIADQNKYIVSVYHSNIVVIGSILQIIVLKVFRNFYLFIIIMVLRTITENVLLSRKADKMYPYINDKTDDKLDKITLSTIKRNSFAMAWHKLGGVLVSSTDSIIISKYIAIAATGIYSNYLLIINAMRGILNQVFFAVTASIGNLCNDEESDKQKSEDIFYLLTYIGFIIFSVTSICLYILLNDFIGIAFGKNLVFSKGIVMILIFNYYISGMRMSIISFRDALGIFWKDRYRPLVEGTINIIVSIILVKQMGMIGVFVGTLISAVTTWLWLDPVILYKDGFNKKPYLYFKKYAIYLCIFVLIGLLTVSVGNVFVVKDFISFIVKAIVVFSISCIGIFISTIGFTEQRKLKELLKELYKNILSRRNKRE